MAKRNPVVRDLIQRPLRGAGKHKDRRKKVDKKFDKEALRGLNCLKQGLLLASCELQASNKSLALL